MQLKRHLDFANLSTHINRYNILILPSQDDYHYLIIEETFRIHYRIQHIMLTSFNHISVDIMSLPDTMMAVVVHGKGEQLSFCLTIANKVEKAIDDLNNFNHISEY